MCIYTISVRGFWPITDMIKAIELINTYKESITFYFTANHVLWKGNNSLISHIICIIGFAINTLKIEYWFEKLF